MPNHGDKRLIRAIAIVKQIDKVCETKSNHYTAIFTAYNIFQYFEKKSFISLNVNWLKLACPGTAEGTS